jgi:hypothetical protein
MRLSNELLAALPDDVPFPSKDEIYQGNYINWDGTACCLVGWARATLGLPPRGAGACYESALVEELACAISGTGGVDKAALWNDRSKTSDVSKKWQKFFVALGYKPYTVKAGKR